MLHGFFFGFTRNLSIFKAKKAKTQKRKLFCHGIQACYKKTRAHAPNSQQHTCRTPGMPCLVECLWQRSGGYLLPKCTVFMEKFFPCISQGMKKA